MTLPDMGSLRFTRTKIKQDAGLWKNNLIIPLPVSSFNMRQVNILSFSFLLALASATITVQDPSDIIKP
jgi:hypothetical protein